MDKKKLNAKDFINIGIFTVIYFVMFFITGMMGYIPIFAVIIPLGLGILGGIPFMLFLTKTGKFGGKAGFHFLLESYSGFLLI